MNPREHFFMNIGGIAAVGIFFIIVGAYIVSTSLGADFSARGIFAGGSCIFLGLLIMKTAYQWANQPKTAPKPPETCPYCGALNEYNAITCQKCQRPIT